MKGTMDKVKNEATDWENYACHLFNWQEIRILNVERWAKQTKSGWPMDAKERISWSNWSGKWNQNSVPQFQRKFRAIMQRLDFASLEYMCQCASPCDVAGTAGPGQTDFLHLLLWIACLQWRFQNISQTSLHTGLAMWVTFDQWNLRRDQKHKGGILRKIFLSDEKSPETKPRLPDLCSLDVVMGGQWLQLL